MTDEEHHDRFDVRDDIAAIAHTPISTATILAAFAAGLAAAVVAGVIWGWIVKTTDYEIGIAAWGVGLLAGVAVLAASRGRKAVPLQVVAVASALVGIVVGKYMSFAFIVDDEFGVGLFSSQTREVFMDELGTIFSAWDALWIGLAVVTAWRLTRPAEHAPAEVG